MEFRINLDMLKRRVWILNFVAACSGSRPFQQGSAGSPVSTAPNPTPSPKTASTPSGDAVQPRVPPAGTYQPLPLGTCAPAGATVYPTVTGAPASATYKLSVDGRPVFVEKFADVSYARFAFCGRVNVVVQVAEAITSANVSPHSYEVAPQIQDRSLAFSLTGPAPRSLVVTVNALEKLLILTDPPEDNPPRPGQAGVFDVTTYPGIDRTGAQKITTELQSAIDDVAGKGGGVLYFPDGRYKTGTLLVKSNVTLYLTAAALIEGTAALRDYRTDYGKQTYQIGFIGVSNAGLIGRGTVDATGAAIRTANPKAGRGNVVKPVRSKNLQIRGVVLRNPGSWTSRISDSDNVIFDQVKVVTDPSIPNTDGLDPDSSRWITISNSFTYVGDDCISPKTSALAVPAQDLYGIRVTGNVCWTKKVGFRIGSETEARVMDDILYENNDILHADRAIGLYPYDGSAISNVRIINNRVEVIGNDRDQALLLGDLRGGSVNNVLIKDLAAETFSPRPSRFTAGFVGLTIENMTVAGKKVTTAAEAHIESASPIVFR